MSTTGQPLTIASFTGVGGVQREAARSTARSILFINVLLLTIDAVNQYLSLKTGTRS